MLTPESTGDVLGRIPAFYAALKAHYIALGVLTSNVQVPSDDDADADQEKKPSYLRTCKDCFGMTVVHAATLYVISWWLCALLPLLLLLSVIVLHPSPSQHQEWKFSMCGAGAAEGVWTRRFDGSWSLL